MSIGDAERERYGKLVEETGEVGQATGKLLVHGRRSEFEGTSYDNVGNLEKELGQLFAVVDMMTLSGDLSRKNIEIARADKLAVLPKTLHYQSDDLATAMYLQAKAIWAEHL